MATAHCQFNASSSSSSSVVSSSSIAVKKIPSSSAHASCALRSGLGSGLKTEIRAARGRVGMKKKGIVTCAVGDVSSDGTTYLIAGAVAITLLGTAYPLLFSRKDLCPECDGAGFIRKTGSALRTNAARKDSLQIVCPTCSGLGKLGVSKRYQNFVNLV